MAAGAGRVPVFVDNTFATPVLQRPTRPAPRSCCTAPPKTSAATATSSPASSPATRTGPRGCARCAHSPARCCTVGAYLLHGGLRTLPVRVRAQQATAGELARRTQGHPASPGCSTRRCRRRPRRGRGTQMRAPGLIATERRAPTTRPHRHRSLRLVTNAVSLGGVDTLAQHPASLTHRPLPKRRGRAAASCGCRSVWSTSKTWRRTSWRRSTWCTARCQPWQHPPGRTTTPGLSRGATGRLVSGTSSSPPTVRRRRK